MNYNFPIAFLDAPQVLNATVTNIPGSASPPLQVIANTGVRSGVAMDYIDSTGDFIGVYLGSSGNEHLLCIIGGGQTTRAWGVFPANSRVSFRSMTASKITNGLIMATVMSY